VSRFEIDDPKGSPRSFSIKFGFGDNEYFEDKVLEKKFWYRKSLDGWEGLVSEPVKVNWKKGQDLTGGFTDAAYELWKARQKLHKTAKSEENIKERSLPEYKALKAKLEESEESFNTFFALFGFVSSYKWVSAEESEQASNLEAEQLEKTKRGEHQAEDQIATQSGEDDQEIEVFPQGDELATLLVEDLWPSALKYYSMLRHPDTSPTYTNTSAEFAHEQDDEELSELEIEDMDEDDSDDEVDIRGLVGKGRNKSAGDSPPSKKQRKA
jgi:hypothetical protein